jgi:hypothetical protein
MVKFFFRRDASDSNAQSGSPNKDVDEDTPMQVIARPELLGEKDSILFRSLVAAFVADAIVIPKARLSDFLSLSKGPGQLKHAIRMDRKWVDFLICDPFSMQPLAVIQRVESEAPIANARQRDPFIAEAIKQADIVMLRIKTRQNYPANKLRELILPKIAKSTQVDAISKTNDLAQRETKTDFGITDTVAIESSITENASGADENRVAKSLDHSKTVIISGRTVTT